MSGLLFTEEHEWLRLEDDDVGVVGISDYAQEQLGEIVFIELPEVGMEVSKGMETAVIESVKAAGELSAPVSGTITEVNEAIAEDPAIVNQDPTGEGWFVKIRLRDADEIRDLMSEVDYQDYVAGLE